MEDMFMPLQTFFNLPVEKQKKIITSAKREFARVPFSEASINNIIKDANISRGSFYQYFDDKEDLFFYLLNEHTKERHKHFIYYLEKNDGNIFKTMLAMFKSILAKLDNNDMHKFYRNVFLHLNYETEKKLINSFTYRGLNKTLAEIKQIIKTDQLNLIDEEDIFHILHILSTVMMQNFILKFDKELTDEEIIENYKAQVNLLKRGFLKSAAD